MVLVVVWMCLASQQLEFHLYNNVEPPTTVEVFWINHQGQFLPMGVVHPGQTVTHHTFHVEWFFLHCILNCLEPQVCHQEQANSTDYRDNYRFE